MNRTVFLSDLTSHSYGSRTPSAPAKEASPHLLMAQPPLLIQEGNSESRFVCMTTRATKCKNWRRQCGHHCSQPPKKWPISRRRSMTAGLSAVIDRRYSHFCYFFCESTSFLYAAASVGEQIISIKSASAGTSFSGSLLRGVQVWVYAVGSSIVTVSSSVSRSRRWYCSWTRISALCGLPALSSQVLSSIPIVSTTKV